MAFYRKSNLVDRISQPINCCNRQACLRSELHCCRRSVRMTKISISFKHHIAEISISFHLIKANGSECPQNISTPLEAVGRAQERSMCRLRTYQALAILHCYVTLPNDNPDMSNMYTMNGCMHTVGVCVEMYPYHCISPNITRSLQAWKLRQDMHSLPVHCII